MKNKVYTYRGKRRKWYQDYNWIWWAYRLDEWMKKKYKRILKFIAKIFLILAGIYLSYQMPITITKTIANFENEKQLKELQIQENAMLAKLRQDELEKQRKEKLQNIELQKQLKIQEEQDRLKEIELEAKEKFNYAWIEITWWNNKEHHTGSTPPLENSKTGQVKKIVGDKLYGTWGDEALVYNDDIFHTISRKEYLELRAKEQRQNDRLNNKKEFKSWGLYPGTEKIVGKNKEEGEKKNYEENK